MAGERKFSGQYSRTNVAMTASLFMRSMLSPTDLSGGGNSLLYCPPPPLPIPIPDPCPTDTNDDGVTNVLDLIDVLLAFGTACP